MIHKVYKPRELDREPRLKNTQNKSARQKILDTKNIQTKSGRQKTLIKELTK